jgi:hypothetical protein
MTARNRESGTTAQHNGEEQTGTGTIDVQGMEQLRNSLEQEKSEINRNTQWRTVCNNRISVRITKNNITEKG